MHIVWLRSLKSTFITCKAVCIVVRTFQLFMRDMSMFPPPYTISLKFVKVNEFGTGQQLIFIAPTTMHVRRYIYKARTVPVPWVARACNQGGLM